MNLLLLVKSVDGGTGTYINQLADLQKINGETKIKTIILEKPKHLKIVNTDKNVFYKHRRFPDKYSLNPLNFIHLIKELIYIKNLAKDFGTDVVLGVELRCNLLAILLKLFSQKKIKVVTTTHLNLKYQTLDKTPGFLKYLLKNFIRIAYNRADLVISVSKGLSRSLKKDFGVTAKVCTIYNGCSVKNIKPTLVNRNKILQVIAVGRLNKQKDTENILNAVSLLPHNKFKLNIYGDGKEKSKLIKICKKLKIEKFVKFYGWIDNPQKIYGKADFLVFSSHAEGFGYVIIEAMSYGLPVISTNTPYGPGEILDKGKYGLLVPTSDAISLKSAMLKMSNSKIRKHYSLMAVKRSKYFSTEKMLNAYYNAFRQLFK